MTIKPYVLLFLLTSLLFAEVSLSGKVVDGAGTPVAGARLVLVDTGLVAYSNSDGTFAFSESVASITTGHHALTGSPLHISFSEGRLNLFLNSSQPHGLTLYSIQGRELLQQRDLIAKEGKIAVDLSHMNLANQLLLLELQSEQGSVVTKLCYGSAVTVGITPKSVLQTRTSRTKRAETLVTDKRGYTAVATAITDLNGSNVIVTLVAGSDLIPAGMKSIPAGTFMMGSDHQLNNPNETPVHQVELSAFYMDSVEITQAEYRALMGKEPWVKQHDFAMSIEQNPLQWETDAEGGLGNKLPAWFLNWYDGVLYCNERSKKEGLDTVYSYSAMSGSFGEAPTLSDVVIDYTVDGYRLPTEAEWEYAYRAGTTTEWYWGTIGHKDTVSMNAWYTENADGDTQPVGTLIPNAWGLYDMSGNIAELCNDFYDSDFYSKSSGTNPIGPETGDKIIQRGGAWIDSDTEIRAARRHSESKDSNAADVGNHINGIRCVRRVQ